MRSPFARLAQGVRHLRRPWPRWRRSRPAAAAPPHGRPARRARRAAGPARRSACSAALAAVAYLPLLLTQRGWVSADTKTYLYLDPSKLMSRAWSMWDPSIGLGTVTHQNVGYLWPMGPFYWLLDTVGVPDWAAQRLWWGTIIFAGRGRGGVPAAHAGLDRARAWWRPPSATPSRPTCSRWWPGSRPSCCPSPPCRG